MLVDRVLEGLVNAINISLVGCCNILHYMALCNSRFQLMNSFLHVFKVRLTVGLAKADFVYTFVPGWTLAMVPASFAQLASRHGDIKFFCR